MINVPVVHKPSKSQRDYYQNRQAWIKRRNRSRGSTTMQLTIASATAATEHHRQQQQTTIALAATAGIFRLLLPKRIRKRLLPDAAVISKKEEVEVEAQVPCFRRSPPPAQWSPRDSPACSSRGNNKNKNNNNNKVSNSPFLICSGFDCELGSIKTN